MKNTVSATELKNKVAEVLNEVYFRKTVAIVERYGRPIAKIVPIEEKKKKTKDELKKAWRETFGCLPDFPDVTRFRRFRNRRVSLNEVSR